MSYRENTIHNNRLFVRCVECGDSVKRHYVGHMGIDLSTGLWHCHRCGSGGRLTTNQFLEYTSGRDIVLPEKIIELSDYDSVPYAQDTRYTLVAGQYNKDEKYRQWAMRKPDGEVIGYHHRFDGGKNSENIGHRGLGYVGRELATTNVLRVVEGVYDVVLPDDVCVFGKITSSPLKLLKYYPLCLCPDTDIIYNKANLQMFARTVLHNMNVEYIEILPKQYSDPGEMFASVPTLRGKIISRTKFLTTINRIFDNQPKI